MRAIYTFTHTLFQAFSPATIGLATSATLLLVMPVHADQVSTATRSETAVEQRMERITHEDAGSRVDELRVGGVTRQIEVQTKSGLPSYQLHPAAQGTVTPASERSGSQGSASRSSWRVLNF